MAKARSPVLGFNHNIRHKGWVFHVQTEDSGVQNPHIFTHLFHDGVIIQSRKCEYDAESDVEIVKGLMQSQHKSVMRELKAGQHDVKIERYLGAPPPGGEKPKDGLPKVPSPGDYATDPGSLPYDAFELSDSATPPPGLDLAATLQQAPQDFAGTVEEPDPELAQTIERQGGEEDDVDVSGVFRMISLPPSDTTRDERPPIPPRPEPRSMGVMPETVPPPMPGYTPGQKRTGQQAVVTPPRPATIPPPARPLPTGANPIARAGTPAQGIPSRPGPTGGQGIVRPSPPPIPIGAGGPKSPPPPPPGRHSPPMPPRAAPAPLPARPVGAAPSGVVVSRPAVVVGAPPKVIGSESSPVPAGPRRAAGHGREFTPPPPTDNIFGQDLISEKSLDEVIMAYLSEDAEEEP